MCANVLSVRFWASNTLLRDSPCRTLSYGGRPQPGWLGHFLHVGLSVTLLEQRRGWSVQPESAASGSHWVCTGPPTFTPSPLRLRAQTARLTPRGLTEVVILKLWPGFPPASGPPWSTKHVLITFFRFKNKGKLQRLMLGAPCCGHPTGQTGEEINTLL